MPHTELDPRSKSLSSQLSRRALWTCWQLAWLVALVVVGLAVGVSAAGGDPEWRGTDPGAISSSPDNRAWQPVIAAGPPAQVAVAWSDQDSWGASRNVYVRRSSDNARTWSTVEVISTTTHQSALPDMCLSGTQVFVAWVDQETVGGQNIAIYEAEVGVGGTRQIPSLIPLTSTWPRLAAGSGKLHMVFNAGAHILYAVRPLGTATWPTATPVYTSTAVLGPWFPTLAVGPTGETLHVVWQEIGFEEWTIMYMRGDAHGAEVSWGPAQSLSQGSTELFYPTIDADSAGNLHVVWGEAVGTGDLDQRDQYVRYTRYDLDSSEWLSPAIRVDPDAVRVNQDNPTYTAPSLTLRERNGHTEVCVAWHGFREGGFGEHVLVSCSWNRGQSWSVPENVSRSVGEEAMSLLPSIAFDEWGQLHGVWQEHNAAMGGSVIYNYQVYHTRALYEVFLPFVAGN